MEHRASAREMEHDAIARRSETRMEERASRRRESTTRFAGIPSRRFVSFASRGIHTSVLTFLVDVLYSFAAPPQIPDPLLTATFPPLPAPSYLLSASHPRESRVSTP